MRTAILRQGEHLASGEMWETEGVAAEDEAAEVVTRVLSEGATIISNEMTPFKIALLLVCLVNQNHHYHESTHALVWW
jgi:hypothetical protein